MSPAVPGPRRSGSASRPSWILLNLANRQLLREDGVADPHQPDANAPLVETQRRYRSTDKKNVARFGGDGGFDYGKSVKTRACLRCGKGCEVAGTSVWWGKGKWLKLNGLRDDHPALIANMEPQDEQDETDS